MKPIKNIKKYMKELLENKYGEKLIRENRPFAQAFNKAMAQNKD